jgi:hypothetical protein
MCACVRVIIARLPLRLSFFLSFRGQCLLLVVCVCMKEVMIRGEYFKSVCVV